MLYSFIHIVPPFFTARRNARIASAVLATAIPYVCPSVRLSVSEHVSGAGSERKTERSGPTIE